MAFKGDETIIHGSISTGGAIEVNVYLTEAPSTTLACHVVCDSRLDLAGESRVPQW